MAADASIMKRRTLLASLAATAGAVGTAGCLQGPGAAPGPDGEPGSTAPEPVTDEATTRDDDAREPNALDPDWNPDGGPVETFAVGDRDAVAFPDANRPHDLTFWNRVDRERDVHVAVVDGATEETGPLGPVTVPAGYTFVVSPQVPTRYALAVSVDDEAFGTVTVGRQWFDCNDSGTSYALGDTGIVDHGTASTLVYCARPEVTTTSVDVTASGCASEDDHAATIAYDGERVHVDGTFVASNPCHELAIADATYRDEPRTATVVLDATHPDDTACQDCVGALDYDATIAFDHDLPDHVEVRHRDASGHTERIATATRNDNR